MVHEIEDFYGVYLLYCLNPRYKGKIYIGYTVNPNRRIKQHNTGAHAGGAHRTSGRGPWDMVLIIHGFPNDVSGLRFEWAWQNPHKSRRLRDVPKKTSKETIFQYRWRVVCNMLRTPPWSGLALTVRWLKQEYQLEFAVGLEPPLHMPIVYGPVVSKKIRNQKKSKKDESCQPSQASSSGSNKSDLPENNFCAVCCIRTETRHASFLLHAPNLIRNIKQYVSSPETLNSMFPHKEHQTKDDIMLRCLHPSCSMVAHIICLAKSFLDDQTKLLPIEGKCPNCRANLLWGELVRQRKGCYKNLSDSAVQQDDDKANTSLETDNADSMSE